MYYLIGLWLLFSSSIISQDHINKLEKYLLSHPIWINANNNWEKEDSTHHYSYSLNGSIIFFYSNHTVFFTGTPLNKDEKTDSISIDVTGWNDYEGTWESDSNRIFIKYSIVDREIILAGDKIPGDIITDTILVASYHNDYKFNFMKTPYITFNKLTYDNRAMLLKRKIKKD